jgi:hypothetical protein
MRGGGGLDHAGRLAFRAGFALSFITENQTAMA